AMKKPLILIGSMLLVLILAALVGGSLVSGSSDEAMEPATADAKGVLRDGAALSDMSAPEQAQSAPAQDTSLQEPALIRTGSIAISTTDLRRDLDRARAVATTLKGSVGAENSEDHGDGMHAQVTLKVPNASFDIAMTRLEEIGDVTRREVSTDDVTTQVIDVAARVRAQRASVASLEKLMSRARTVGEVMSVERELTQRQATLDSLLQQQRYLADQTSMSTISVSLTDDPDEKHEQDSGFLGGLKAGWNALGDLATGAATALGAVLPFIPLVLVVGLPVWFVVRRRRAAATEA
ncbi:MAG: DUF4349 domain-containing protein, partial [Myxococcales bacterium]